MGSFGGLGEGSAGDGGVGCIVLRATTSCSVDGNVLISPPISRGDAVCP